MSSAVSDPTSLTKDKLRRELSKLDIDLPASDAKKEVYVDLYRTHILNQTSEFSADEEFSPKPRRVGSRGILFTLTILLSLSQIFLSMKK